MPHVTSEDDVFLHDPNVPSKAQDPYAATIHLILQGFGMQPKEVVGLALFPLDVDVVVPQDRFDGIHRGDPGQVDSLAVRRIVAAQWGHFDDARGEDRLESFLIRVVIVAPYVFRLVTVPPERLNVMKTNNQYNRRTMRMANRLLPIEAR